MTGKQIVELREYVQWSADSETVPGALQGGPVDWNIQLIRDYNIRRIKYLYNKKKITQKKKVIAINSFSPMFGFLALKIVGIGRQDNCRTRDDRRT